MNPMSWESVVIACFGCNDFISNDMGNCSNPRSFEIISNSPNDAIYLAMLFGFLWGIGGIMFGVSVPYIGLSLTMGIVMGLAGSAGSLILFQIENATFSPHFLILLEVY